jgi:Sigma-70, region 4
MATVDSLPPDQRAVLQLVLQRGRSYDDIATLLSIDRAAVRQRALAGLDALGPQTRLAPERRSLITDYLLGQLPGPVCDDTRNSLAGSAGERAWARVVASELAPLATQGLPEIPAEDSAGRSEGAAATPAARIAQDYGRPEPKPAATSGGGGGKPSSRIGGAVLLGIGALIAVVVVVIVIASNSGSSTKSTSSAGATTPTTASTPATGTSTTGAKPVAQINLTPPTGGSSPTGIAEVVKQGSANGIVIVAQGVTANSKHDAYAVWLYKSPTQAKILGFVNPGVASNGRLSTAGPLPTDAANYSQLLVTLETQADPKAPGKIVLQGNLTLG